MTKNEIKKALYREKPRAKALVSNSDGDTTYGAKLKDGTEVRFFVPYSEGLHELNDSNNPPAQLLIRWLQTGVE